MAEFITIAKASKLVGHSENTIHRLIRKILMKNDDLDSDKIRLGKGESGFNYTIEKTFLLDQFQEMKDQGDDSIYSKEYTGSSSPPVVVSQTGRAANNKAGTLPRDHNLSADPDIVHALLGQLQQKDKLVSELLDRIKELNMIIMGLQKNIVTLETKNIQNEETTEIDLNAQDVTKILDSEPSQEL